MPHIPYSNKIKTVWSQFTQFKLTKIHKYPGSWTNKILSRKSYHIYVFRDEKYSSSSDLVQTFKDSLDILVDSKNCYIQLERGNNSP